MATQAPHRLLATEIAKTTTTTKNAHDDTDDTGCGGGSEIAEIRSTLPAHV